VQAKKMNDIFENDRKFKEAIGAFIIAFSELEFGLAILCTLTEFDPRHKDKFLSKYIGYSFEQKRNTLSDFIKKELTEIEKIWCKINTDIGQINRERRFIAHGFMTYSLPNENISTYVKEKGKIVEQKQSIEKIEGLTKTLNEINTGRNGINGEFHTQFTKMRIDKWNDLVIEKNRIVYRVNNEIISQWKG
jgi:hypothetical protein